LSPGLRQERWDRLEPHPTDMPILNDAGAAPYPRELIYDRLGREQIAMTSLLTGEAFGPLPRAVAIGWYPNSRRTPDQPTINGDPVRLT
jgi:hypothetical protein